MSLQFGVKPSGGGLPLDGWRPSSVDLTQVQAGAGLHLETVRGGESFAHQEVRGLALVSLHPYRLSATVVLDAPVEPLLAVNALRMALVSVGTGGSRSVLARSRSAVNSAGRHDLQLEVPAGTLLDGLQLELHLGGRGSVIWTDLRAEPVPRLSTRRLRRRAEREVGESWAERVELARRIAADETCEAAELLHSVLDDPRTTTALAHETADRDRRIHARATGPDRRLWRRRMIAPGKAAARLDGRVPWPTVISMLQTRPGNLRERMHLWLFFAPRMKELRRAAREPRTSAGRTDRVFTYWAQGLDEAPPLVRTNFQRMRSVFRDRLVVLTDENRTDWVETPELESLRPNLVPRERSDVLRMDLLRTHGGLWLDATCLVTEEFNAPPGFFAFPKEDRRAEGTARLSVWALASEPGGYLVSLFAEALHAYWSSHDEALDYYVIHHIFEVLCLLDADFDDAWQTAATVGRAWGIRPRDMSRLLTDGYDPATAAELLRASPVHKLTQKGAARRAGERSLMAAVLRGVV